MNQILTGIFVLLIVVLIVASFAYSDNLYQIEQSMRKYNDGELVSESLVGYVPTSPKETTEKTEATAETTESLYDGAVRRMTERGLLPVNFNPNARFTRARLAVVVCDVLGVLDEAAAMSGETPFVDVPADYWASGYINYAAQNGLIGGDADKYYNPDSVVKFEDAVKVFVCIVGMDDELWIDPLDWSSAYLYCAEENGLLDGLAGKKGDDMLCSDLAIIADRMVTLLGTEKVATAATEDSDAAVAETVTADSDASVEPEDTAPAETAAK